MRIHTGDLYLEKGERLHKDILLASARVLAGDSPPMSSEEVAHNLGVRFVTCGVCRGSGWIIRDLERPAQRCYKCGGTGKNKKAVRPMVIRA